MGGERKKPQNSRRDFSYLGAPQESQKGQDGIHIHAKSCLFAMHVNVNSKTSMTLNSEYISYVFSFLLGL